MSARTAPDEIELALAAGADAFIGKPFQVDALIAKVASLLADR